MRLSDNAARKLFMFLGVGFLAAGVFIVIISLWLNVRMDNSRQVTARVVDVIESVEHRKDVNNHNNHYSVIMYTSVYEYEDGGEVKTYTSNVSTSKRAEIGSETTLYISDNGKIYERGGAKVAFFVGIFFAFVGGIFTLITFKVWKKNPEETEERYL